VRVLLISYHFPPDPAPQGHRWAQLCQETVQMGFSWQVITPTLTSTRIKAGDDKPLQGARQHRPGVQVHHTRVGWRHQLYKLQHGQPELGKPVQHVLHRILNGHDRVQQPDAVAEWMRTAVNQAKKVIRQESIDLIVSAGPPVSAHVAGQRIARATGLPWIADWNTPWGIDPALELTRSPLMRGADTRLEQTLVREADGVIVTSDALARVYRGFRESNDTGAVFALHNGFSPFEVAKASRFLAGIQRNRIRFTCTGESGNTDESLELLEAFALHPKLADRAELVFVSSGNQPELQRHVAALALTNSVLFLHNLAPSEVLALQLSSQALLSFGLNSPYQIPQELSQYAGSGRPVLFVRCNRLDPSFEVLGYIKRFLITENNRFSISHALERATNDDWDDGGATPIEGLYWATIAEQLSLWLESRLARAQARKVLREPVGSAQQMTAKHRSSGD
jgi:hypothetical protein